MGLYNKLVFKNYKCNKSKYILMMLGIIVSVIILFAVFTFSKSFKSSLYNEMKVSDEKILTIALGNRDNSLNYKYLPVFTQDYVDVVNNNTNIVASTGVKGITASKITFQSATSNKQYMLSSNIIYGGTKDFIDQYGGEFESGNFSDNDDSIVIGKNIAEAYCANIGDTLKIEYNQKVKDMKISGILSKQKEQAYSSTPSMINNMILINLDHELMSDTNYIFISALVNDVKNIESTTNELEDVLNNDIRDNDLVKKTLMNVVVISRLDVLHMIDGWFVYINLFIALLSVIICFIVIINLSNLMIITILQRKKEIGIMKVIGGSNQQISYFYLLECLTIGAVATILGLIISLIMGYIVTKIIGWSYCIDISHILLIILITIGSPVVSGLTAQLRIKKIEIVDAFMNE